MARAVIAISPQFLVVAIVSLPLSHYQNRHRQLDGFQDGHSC